MKFLMICFLHFVFVIVGGFQVPRGWNRSINFQSWTQNDGDEKKLENEQRHHKKPKAPPKNQPTSPTHFSLEKRKNLCCTAQQQQRSQRT